jgi:hypothetical protein
VLARVVLFADECQFISRSFKSQVRRRSSPQKVEGPRYPSPARLGATRGIWSPSACHCNGLKQMLNGETVKGMHSIKPAPSIIGQGDWRPRNGCMVSSCRWKIVDKECYGALTSQKLRVPGQGVPARMQVTPAADRMICLPQSRNSISVACLGSGD